MGAIIVRGSGESRTTSTFIDGYEDQWTASGGGWSQKLDVVAVRHAFGPVLHSNPSLVENGSATVSDSNEATAGSLPADVNVPYPVAIAEANGSLTSTLLLPACDHAPFKSGDSIVADVRVEKWRLGIWVQEVTTIYHP